MKETDSISIALQISTPRILLITQAETLKLERIQKTCLKVIQGDMFIDYRSALAMSGLETLYSGRSKRCYTFFLKCKKHSMTKSVCEHVWERAPGPKVPVKSMNLILLEDVSQRTEHQGCVRFLKIVFCCL